MLHIADGTPIWRFIIFAIIVRRRHHHHTSEHFSPHSAFCNHPAADESGSDTRTPCIRANINRLLIFMRGTLLLHIIFIIVSPSSDDKHFGTLFL